MAHKPQVVLVADCFFALLTAGQAVEREGHDRPDTELPGQQKALLEDVINHCECPSVRWVK